MTNLRFNGQKLATILREKKIKPLRFRYMIIQECMNSGIKPPSWNTMYKWSNGESFPKDEILLIMGKILELKDLTILYREE